MSEQVKTFLDEIIWKSHYEITMALLYGWSILIKIINTSKYHRRREKIFEKSTPDPKWIYDPMVTLNKSLRITQSKTIRIKIIHAWPTGWSVTDIRLFRCKPREKRFNRPRNCVTTHSALISCRGNFRALGCFRLQLYGIIVYVGSKSGIKRKAKWRLEVWKENSAVEQQVDTDQFFNDHSPRTTWTT